MPIARHRPVPPGLALAVLSLCGCATTGLPPEAKRHNAAGAEALAAGRLDDAEARFHLALEYHPRFSEPRANLGLVALRRGDLDAAEEHLRGAVRLNEDFAEAWANLGVVLDRQQRPAAAQEAYQRALSIDPGLLAPRRNLAHLLARRDRFDDARAHLMRFVQLAPSDAQAQALLAYCELRLGRAAEADERAERALAEDADAPVALVVRGLSRARRGELDAAVRDLRGAKDDPLVGRHARTRLAALLLARGAHGDRAEVAELLRSLLEADPTDPAVRLVAAWAALEAERPWDARAHAEAALDVRPDLDEARLVLARACHAEGDPGCAREALDGLREPGPRLERAARRLRALLAGR